MAACFHHLKGLTLKPLSRAAKSRAANVLRELRACVRAAAAYDLGKPVVRNLSRGRAFFGFEPLRGGRPNKRVAAAMHACERRVHLAARIDRIIAVDRATARDL
jgi:hypothetical protein